VSNRQELEKAAKASNERILSGEFCKEDQVICYALSYIECIEGRINRYATAAENCDSGAMVVEIGQLEGHLAT